MAEKNLIGELDMYREAGIKPNFSDIAKRYGKDRHTVASYWRAEGGRPRDGRGDRAGSFDAHIEEVAAKAQLPGVTKKGIHEWLLHRYPGEDLAGYNAFTQFMRKNGIAVGASGGPEPHPRFETPPGLQLQFDWKESVKMANRDGELFEFNVFAATLGHSRRHIFIRSRTRTTDDLVRCMYATIARLGGVPREWVTDNMSALVTVKGGRRLKVQRAYEFAKAAGFELKLCRPRSPQTKGKVYEYYRYNDSRMATVEKTERETGKEYDTAAKKFFDEFYYGDYYGVDLRNYALNMTRLYVLVTGNTASSSEAVINTLRGLDGFTVKLIGEKTNGKNVGMEVSKFTVGNYSYELAPISFQGYNAKQVTVNKDGLAVDTACEEWNGELKDYGDRSEPMLAAALSQITGQRSASVSGTRSTAPGVRPATDIALPDLSNRPSGMIVFLPAAEE